MPGEGVGDPASGVVHQDVYRSQLFFGGVEQPGRGDRVGQVSLDGYCPAAVRPDLGGNGLGVPHAVITVGLRRTGISGVLDPQEGAQHRAPAPPERQLR